MKFQRNTLILLFFFLYLPGCSAVPPADWPPPDTAFPRATLRITTPDHRQHRFQVWVANTAALRARGLMLVDHLAPDQGMLLLYPRATTVAIWMKNTTVPLDLLFVDGQGQVVQIATHTTPLSLARIEATSAVIAVLELPAGSCERLHLVPGTQVALPDLPAD